MGPHRPACQAQGIGRPNGRDRTTCAPDELKSRCLDPEAAASCSTTRLAFALTSDGSDQPNGRLRKRRRAGLRCLPGWSPIESHQCWHAGQADGLAGSRGPQTSRLQVRCPTRTVYNTWEDMHRRLRVQASTAVDNRDQNGWGRGHGLAPTQPNWTPTSCRRKSAKEGWQARKLAAGKANQ